MIAEIEGFEWDAANVDHILRHAVTPYEVEETVQAEHILIRAKPVKGEERWKIFGKAESGRYLVIVFSVRHRLFRTVTAYSMNKVERRKYGPQIDR